MGVQLRAVRYRLDQLDSTQSSQVTRERWNEWTHTLGTSFITRSLEVHILWRLRSGTSRPGTTTSNGFFPDLSGSLSQTSALVPVRTITEQFSITVPIR